jgi:hypothetical protein
MSTIPASEIVQINPSVIAAGGNALDAIGFLLSNSTRVPIGTVLSFPNGLSVSNYFGATAAESIIANGGAGKGSGYFGGFIGEQKVPGNLLIAQYNQSAVPAYLRGGNISALTVAQLNAISGTLTISVDGISRVGGSISLGSAASFSAGAATIQTALNTTVTLATFNAGISGTTMTVNSVSGGTLAVGQTVSGSGVALTTIITAFLTATGSVGTYTVSQSQTIGNETMTAQPTPLTVTYDSVSGAYVITSGAGVTGASSTIAFPTGTLPAQLLLTAATGAVLSQGAAAATPAGLMNSVIAITTAWVCFMTAFDPDGGVGNTLKQAFAAWKNAQNNRYAYICWDTDITPTQSVPATSSLGYILANNNDSGTCLIYEASDLNLAAFVMGTAAAINFEQPNGRITFAFKSQAGLTASVSDPTTAANLAGNPQGPAGNNGNGYNFYGAYASATQNFTWFQRGFVTGTYKWLDSYLNQIVMNNTFMNSLLTLFQSSLSVPYTVAGNNQIQGALAGPIQQFLAFGAYAPGTLSATEIAEVNAAANANISNTLQTQGYYLQIVPATATQRASRLSPTINFYYIDRGAVQAITLASVELQ